jgi:hypothetical protein
VKVLSLDRGFGEGIAGDLARVCVDVGMHDQVDETAALMVQGVDLAAFDVEHPTVQAQLLPAQGQGDRGVGAQAVELVDDVLADQVIDLGLLGVVVVGLAAFAELQKTSDEAVHDRVLAPSLCDGIWSRHGIMSKTDCLRLG